MEPTTSRAPANLTLDESYTYTVIGFLDAISEMKLDDIDSKVLGLDPKDLLMVYCFLVALGTFGIVGNVISMIVWSRPQLKSSSAILLTALAASDFFIIVCTIGWQFLAILVFNYRTSNLMYIYHNILPYIVLFMDPVSLIAETASEYLTVVITIERYIAVCHPFKYQELCSYSRACISSASVIIFSILYNMIQFWTTEVQPHHRGNQTTYHVHVSELGSNYWFKIIYGGYMYLIVVQILPLGSIIIFNTAMCFELSKGKQERELTDLQKKEKRLTLMLVYVIVEFIVCTAVIGFIALCLVLTVSRYQGGFDLYWCGPMIIFSRTFNSSINFVTYIIFGGPFRKTFLEMFGCCN